MPNTLLRAIEQPQPSVILNAASYGVNHGHRDADAMVAVNVTAVHQLIKAARASGIRRLIQLGTYSEYGDHTGPLTEDTPLRPKNAYGATKAAAQPYCIHAGNRRGARHDSSPLVQHLGPDGGSE